MSIHFPTIDPGRLARIKRLDRGEHNPPNGEFAACAMEAVAYVAGEPWSDAPECACPILTAFLQAWNDDLGDDERTSLLLPLVPRIVGTRGSEAMEVRRATMAGDWYVRVFIPAWLRLAKLDEHADTLADYPEITSVEQAAGVLPALEAADNAALARSAGWIAVLSTMRSAAGPAAWSTVWSKARSVESAGWSAARSAAWSAAEAAAWVARSPAALSDTRVALQASALDLISRMIDAQDAEQEAA